MILRRVIAAVVGITLTITVSACGNSGPNTPAAGATAAPANSPTATGAAGSARSRSGTTAVPDTTATYTTPAPANSSPALTASPQDQVLYELHVTAIKMAGVARPTTGSCEPKVLGSQDQTVVCTLNWDGLSVRYNVKISGGGTVFSFRATPEKGLLAGAGVRAKFAGEFSDQAQPGTLACDGNLPEKELVTLESKTTYNCYYTAKYGDQKTVNVQAAELGPTFMPVSGG